MRTAKNTLPKVQVRKLSQQTSNQTTYREEGLRVYEKHYEMVKNFPTELDRLFRQMNQQAMRMLEKPSTAEMSLIMLQWIIDRAKGVPQQMCLALNNLGCAYRRMGKTQLACNTLERALELTTRQEELELRTITYLNLTAVLSQMGLHERALKCAEQGVQAAKREFKAHEPETVKYAAISYYNLGNELDSLDRLEEAVRQYKRAVEFAQEHLGESDPLYRRFKQSHQIAKQKLIVRMSHQTEQSMRQLLLNKKQFEIPSEDSVMVTPQQQTRKNFMIRKNNFMEDQLTDSKATLKANETREKETPREVPGPPTAKQDQHSEQIQTLKSRNMSFQSPQQPKSDLEQLGVKDWSDSEPSDKEVKKQISRETPVQMKLQSARGQNKEQRLNFLNRLNVGQKMDENLMEREQQIIREVEGMIYNQQNIKLIQAQFRMKKERQKFLKLRQRKKEEGNLLPSDELKLKKFQRFVKRKLVQLKIRGATRRLVYRIRLRKYPNKEMHAFQTVQAILDAQRVYQHMHLVRTSLLNKQYRTVRSQLCFPLRLNGDQVYQTPVSECYYFSFMMAYPSYNTVKFTLTPENTKLRNSKHKYFYETDTDEFIRCLGLLKQYIGQIECFQIEENDLLRTLRKLEYMANQFLFVVEVDSRYLVKLQVETNDQLFRHFQRLSSLLQELTVIEKDKLIIRGINNFEYQEKVPQLDSQLDLVVPMHLRTLNELDLRYIQQIQSAMRGFLSRKKLSEVVTKTKRQIYYQKIIRTEDDYIQLVKAIERKSNKQILYLVDMISKRKTNDLQIYSVVFRKVGDITRENIHEILLYNLETGQLDYTEEAQYWISKYEESNKKGVKFQSVTLKESAAILIQRKMLHYLIKRRTAISKIYNQRNQFSNKEITREILVRRAIIYGDSLNSRACLTTFYLYIEKADPLKSVMGQSEYQSIMLVSKSLEHINAFDKVQPYFQRLFYALDRSLLQTIAQKMVDYSKIVKAKKEGLKVHTKNLDEVQGEIMNLAGDSEQARTLRDITLDARLKLNSAFREKFIGQGPEVYECEALVSSEHGGDQSKQSNFVRQIQNLFKKYSKNMAAKLSETKHVNVEDPVSVSNYVKNFLPTTEYGNEEQVIYERQQLLQKKATQTALQIPQENQRLTKRKTLLLQESLVIFNDQVVIDGHDMQIQILYSQNMHQLIILGECGNKQYKTAVQVLALVGDSDVNHQYIVENIAATILQQLHFSNELFYFKLNQEVQAKFLQEYHEFNRSEHSKSQHQQQQSLTEQRSISTLPEVGSMVKLSKKVKGTVQIDYYYNRQAKTICIMLTDSKGIQECITIDTADFQSRFVEVVVPDMPAAQVQRFFVEFVENLNKLLEVSETLHHNFDQLRPSLSVILQEKFVQKIQGMLMVRKMVDKLKLYKKLKHPELFMHKYIENSNQNYVEFIYLLRKAQYELKIIVKELTFTTAQGHVVERSKQLQSKRRLREKHFTLELKQLSTVQSSMLGSRIRKQDQMDYKRIDYQVLSNYDQMKTIEYYRQLMTPLINMMQKNVVINFQKFQFDFGQFPIQEIQVRIPRQVHKGQGVSFGSLARFARKLQAAYKRMKHKEWFILKLTKKSEVDLKNRFIGQFVKRSFKKILCDEREHFYIVNIYKKTGKTQGSLKLTYELILQEKSERKTSRLRGYYVWEPTQLLNLGSRKLVDYIMELVYVEDGIVRFREYQMGCHEHEEIPTVSQIKKGQIIEEDVEEKLVAHEEKGDSLYNVIYTGARRLRDKKQGEQPPNSITLEVNMKSIRKLYPHINVKNQDTMKIVSSNLISGLKVQQGQLQVDQSRIQSSFINLQSSQLEKRSSGIIRPSKPHLKQDLIKTTVTYAGEKYLLVIYFLERKIAKILKSKFDQVFQEYERVFLVQATNLSRLDEPIIWELTLEDAKTLTHEQERDRIATIMSKRIQVLNSKFIYLCYSEEDLLRVTRNSNVILFVENTIAPIQNRFRNRKLKNNYQYYRMTLKQYRDEEGFFTPNVAMHEIRQLAKTKPFIVFFVEDEHKKLRFFAWDFCEAFYMFQLEIPKQRFLSLLNDDKKQCMRALVNFITYVPETGKLNFSVQKPEMLQEYFEEEKRQASMHQSSKENSPMKEQQEFFKYDEDNQAYSEQSASPQLQPTDLEFDDQIQEI